MYFRVHKIKVKKSLPVNPHPNPSPELGRGANSQYTLFNIKFIWLFDV